MDIREHFGNTSAAGSGTQTAAPEEAAAGSETQTAAPEEAAAGSGTQTAAPEEAAADSGTQTAAPEEAAAGSETQASSIEKGALYLVATPIGNLEDMTFRAVRTLKEADLICAEDTRTSGKLLSHYGIHTPVTAYHEHNKRSKLPALLNKLLSGQTLAVITDAGTPGISDPGEELACACMEEGISVYAVPGAVAAVCALTTSGLSSRRFAFEAFLPKKKKRRQQVLGELAKETRTIVMYEAPHHLASTLEELRQILGDGRRVTLCRELTKRFEDKVMFTLKEACAYYREHEARGEFVVVIEGKSVSEVEKEEHDKWSGMSFKEHMAYYEGKGMDRKAAMKQVAVDRGIPKREVYAALYRYTV